MATKSKKSAKPAKKAPAKAAAKKPAPKKAAARSTGKKGGAANSAFMKPMQPSPALAAMVGSEPQPRSEITKRIWAYIKKNNLQDAKDRRSINADDKLAGVFGSKKQVTMFELTKLVNKHLS